MDLLAEMDVGVANSACPSHITPTNAHNPTPMRLVSAEEGVACKKQTAPLSEEPHYRPRPEPAVA